MLRTTRSLRPMPLFLLALATLLLLAGPAPAEPRVKPGGEALGMIGYVIDHVDPTAATITVGGETHHVVAGSRLENASGQRIGLRDLRGMDSHGVADMVRFTTRRSGANGNSEILELRLVDLGRP